MLDFTDIPGDSFHVGPAVGIGSNLDLSRINSAIMPHHINKHDGLNPSTDNTT